MQTVPKAIYNDDNGLLPESLLEVQHHFQRVGEQNGIGRPNIYTLKIIHIELFLPKRNLKEGSRHGFVQQ